ncbi:MAG: tRNA pseudouridine(38-40) synthase TruA [Gammaproteobacteria bacterium]|nr:tRNA pseudouridine(38-40) synthase TruA [Gammaproteobacteria bacterium]
MRIALGIEYDGTAYNGWQRQKIGRGVQARVEKALSEVANHEVVVICSGRTDTGVHASGQVIHFDTNSKRTEQNWILGANSNLPDDINVQWAAGVADAFNARYCASARTYRYLILNSRVRSALFRHRVWCVHDPLDEKRMQAGADYLLGKHDFSAFRAAGCQASTPVRDMSRLDVERHGSWLSITVTANAFLQHMVRNITGTLVAIGNGEREPEWAQVILAGRDRTAGGIAAPAQGLTLVKVDYPADFEIPISPIPDLLPGKV